MSTDGPGSRPDPHCLEAAGRLRNAGVRGPRPSRRCAHGAGRFGELVSDAHRYLDWYRVDGFLLDRCPDRPRRRSPRCRRTVGDAPRRPARRRRTSSSGHGTHPYPGYAEAADQLVTFSGPWTDYRWSQVAEWTADHPPERFCALRPRRAAHAIWTRRCASPAGRAPGTICFTDRTDRGAGTDPWAALPGYWDEIVSRIGPGVSE